MATLDQVILQIRFGLEQLSASNAHHSFEHLSRHYARALVCSNILPATGPVSAGGDQARDFETFRTYLQDSPIGSSAFVGRVSEGPVAFACTIQKDTQRNPLTTKIKTDVDTILASGTSVVGIHYFCAADLPIARRHELQAWCQSEHQVELEIHDGQAISENLAQRETFWVAVRYLGIPSEIYPRDTALQDEGYETALQKWKTTEIDCDSYFQFEEVKQLVRYVTTEESVKQDLPFWIDTVNKFDIPQASRDLRRLARYEVSVATLRGLGSLVGHEASVAEYFDDIEPIESLSELEDGVNLLSFCLTAQVMEVVAFDLQQLESWHRKLIAHIDDGLQDRTFKSTAAYLLRLRGQLALHEFSEDGISIGIDETFEWFAELAEILPEAKLFPVERFSDTLSMLCSWVGDHPKFHEITAKVDEVLLERIGGFAVASKCRDRAMAFHKSGRVLKAISEIHQARLNWYAAETLEGCILALLVLARWYSEIGLTLAGKYHALAATYIAIREDDTGRRSRAWKSAAEAAHCDYSLGAFAGFLDLIRLARILHTRFAERPVYLEDEPSLEPVIYHCSWVVYLSERLASHAANLMRQRVNDLGLGDPLEACLQAMHETFDGEDDETTLQRCTEQFFGMPVNDVGSQRVVAWNALGVDWSVQWNNLYIDTVFAEQFIACLQIVQLELVDVDLCLPRTSVHVQFQLANVEIPQIEPVLGKDGFVWRLLWPTDGEVEGSDAAFIPVLSATVMLLGSVSYQKQENIVHLLETLFENGVPAKTVIAQSYATVYTNFFSDEVFNEGRAIVVTVDDVPTRFPVRFQPELAGKSGPGPDYSKEAANEKIQNRYTRIAELMPVTLAELKRDPTFHLVVLALRAKGWKDWHILSAVYTTALNFDLHRTYGPHGTLAELHSHMMKFASTPENSASEPIPAGEFTAEKLEFSRQGNLGAVLQSWGFEIHHPAFTPEVTEDFLARRYGYWDDDIEHPDLFGI